MPQEGGKVWNRIIPGRFLNQVYHFGGAYYKDENILGSISGSPYSGKLQLRGSPQPGIPVILCRTLFTGTAQQVDQQLRIRKRSIGGPPRES